MYQHPWRNLTMNWSPDGDGLVYPSREGNDQMAHL